MKGLDAYNAAIWMTTSAMNGKSVSVIILLFCTRIIIQRRCEEAGDMQPDERKDC